MKKICIITCVLFAGLQVQAVHLSSNGLGQVLIFPYYTVNGGFNTLINLVNTTDQAKALRVRFREAANSREVMTFNLYLGPYDVWVGALSKGDEGQGYFTRIKTPDTSCTIPAIGGQGVLFTDEKYQDDNTSIYDTDVSRMHEGFIEIIEMGVLTGDSALATLINSEQPSANCTALQNAWDDGGYWNNDSATDLLPPSGGIMGNVILIDVASGITMSEEATVLDNFTDEILHFDSNSDSPNLADGMTSSTISNNSGFFYDMQWETGFEAVSSVLMKGQIANEYALGNNIGAKTEWVMTLPTKQFHTDNGIVAPFVPSSSSAFNCQVFTVTGLFDREERTPNPEVGTVIFIGMRPPNLINPALCYASNLLEFENTDRTIGDSVILSSRYSVLDDVNFSPYHLITQETTSPTYFDFGWVPLHFPQNTIPTNQEITIGGLPIIGFAIQRYTNSSLGSNNSGVLANYAGIFNHKSNTPIYRNDQEQIFETGMHIANNNKGQVLIYPYYTVKNGLNTLISVVNPTDEVKALKIRFREGKNARIALDFNLYLSPYDVWTAALRNIVSTVNSYSGQASVMIRTSDTSCTVPSINGQEFLPYDFDVKEGYDGQGRDLTRVQEGSIEIIEMGTVINTATNGGAAYASTHVNGTPQSCASLVSNWNPTPAGAWIDDPNDGLLFAPDGTGGLYGSLSLIDVGGGVDMTYDATAIVGYSTQVQHTNPANTLPNLASGTSIKTSIDTEDGFIQTTWGSPVDAVTALFMQSQVSNDFVVDSHIGAQSEWVNFFPTKQFYIDPVFSGSALALPPFKIGLTPFYGSCEYHRLKAFNREQDMNTVTDIPLIGTPPPNFSSYPEDCWSVNVSDINKGIDDNTLFDSHLNINDWYADNQYTSINDLPFGNGWMQMNFVDEVANPGKLVGMGANGETHEIYGKPVLGFVAQKYVNGTLGTEDNRVLANYAVINMNKGTRKLVVTPATN